LENFGLVLDFWCLADLGCNSADTIGYTHPALSVKIVYDVGPFFYIKGNGSIRDNWYADAGHAPMHPSLQTSAWFDISAICIWKGT